jgi:hypothetical protein
MRHQFATASIHAGKTRLEEGSSVCVAVSMLHWELLQTTKPMVCINESADPRTADRLFRIGTLLRGR